jgi:hypothetical protein
MDPDHCRLLRRVDHKELRLRPNYDRTRKALALPDILPVVHLHFVFAEINNQLHRPVRQQPLLVMRLLIPVVMPQHVHEMRKRRPRDVAAVQHLV